MDQLHDAMKTTEELDKEIDRILQLSTYQMRKLAISEALLDAFKAGMTEAADIAAAEEEYPSVGAWRLCANRINRKILTARDNKKEI